MKTLGFFCALQKGRCLFSSENSDVYEDPDPTAASQFYKILGDNHAGEKDLELCNGRLLLHYDPYYGPFIQCKHWKKGHHDHLLQNLQELDPSCLEAPFNNDIITILKYGEATRNLGYGPLVSCHTVCTPQEQKLLFSNWHHNSDGILKRGEILLTIDCPTCYEIYYPNELEERPYIALYKGYLKNSWSPLDGNSLMQLPNNSTLIPGSLLDYDEY
ncbi:hypothetical protein M422DRAFT_257935 [Sphaerobolus stellatus SS14]|uniref:Uncharacterized protein n=1 Tax=Sphaerobolus stellatus (strain SS14) TaxID=990650 RepID=A0A0C9U8G1_SPHS4|nr:hypothetical protein M422DRAFT_257935 [Sphaerobolus stellatus SS14]